MAQAQPIPARTTVRRSSRLTSTLINLAVGFLGLLTVALAATRPDLVTRAVLVNPALPRPKGNLESLTRTAKFAALMVPRAATPIVRARARRLGHEGLVDATLAMAGSEPPAAS